MCLDTYEWNGECNGLSKGDKGFKRYCSIICKYADQLEKEVQYKTYDNCQQATNEFISKLRGYALRECNRLNNDENDQYEDEIFNLIFKNKDALEVKILVNGGWIRTVFIYKETLHKLNFDEENIMEDDIRLTQEDQ